MTFPPPPPTRFRCPDSAREIIARHVCLSSFSKNLEGELQLLHEEEEKCAPLKCVTLKTEHYLIVKVQPNGPWVLRAPFGAWNGTVTREVNATPMKKYIEHAKSLR